MVSSLLLGGCLDTVWSPAKVDRILGTSYWSKRVTSNRELTVYIGEVMAYTFCPRFRVRNVMEDR